MARAWLEPEDLVAVGWYETDNGDLVLDDESAAAATGKRHRYRYYTCFSRQGYGKDECASERLPADELDDAILAALLATYEDSDVVGEAIAAAGARADELHERVP